MKNLFSKIMHNKVLVIVLAIIVIAFPSAIVKPAQGETTTIVVAVGIEKKDDNYLISMQSANPQSNSQSSSQSQSSSASQNGATLEIIEGSGKTIADAFTKIQIKTGKKLGFEHCHLIVLGDSVSGENCKIMLDSLYRKANITLNTYLISTDVSAKYILQNTSDIETDASGSIQNNLNFNKNFYSVSNITTLGTFFNDFYSLSKCSMITFLPSKEPSETSEQATAKSEIENNGQTAIFLEGKKVALLDRTLTSGTNWINLNKIEGAMTVEGVSDEKYYNNATITLHIRSGKIKVNPEIVNDILVLKTKISIYVEVSEVNQDNSNLNLNSGYRDYLTDALKNKIKEKINSEINALDKFCEENKIDICHFKSRFYRQKNSAYKKWQKNHTDEDLFKFGRIETDISIYSFR